LTVRAPIRSLVRDSLQPMPSRSGFGARKTAR
jgi:hypothetical protein